MYIFPLGISLFQYNIIEHNILCGKSVASDLSFAVIYPWLNISVDQLEKVAQESIDRTRKGNKMHSVDDETNRTLISSDNALSVAQSSMPVALLQIPPSTNAPQQQLPPYQRRQPPPPPHHHHPVTHSAHGRRRTPSPVSRRNQANHHAELDPRTY
ncbi:unnamed protein product [Adineta ricciae]|uniref:Uncharacterized protein n=1 Tax=Adineta ricciae TaxID=249248 RepID=A0A814T386_ADIRI|nr:unnamed protein product [Adineta ricciae]